MCLLNINNNKNITFTIKYILIVIENVISINNSFISSVIAFSFVSISNNKIIIKKKIIWPERSVPCSANL